MPFKTKVHILYSSWMGCGKNDNRCENWSETRERGGMVDGSMCEGCISDTGGWGGGASGFVIDSSHWFLIRQIFACDIMFMCL